MKRSAHAAALAEIRTILSHQRRFGADTTHDWSHAATQAECVAEAALAAADPQPSSDLHAGGNSGMKVASAPVSGPAPASAPAPAAPSHSGETVERLRRAQSSAAVEFRKNWPTG